MNLKKILITVFTLMLACNMKVSAFSQSISNIAQSGNNMSYNGSDTFALKYYDSTAVFCTQFHQTSPAGRDIECTLSENWANEIMAGVGYIISQVGAVPISGDATENYYYGELAINQFLYKSGVDTDYTHISKNDSREVSQILGSRKSWYDQAIAVSDEVKSNSINIKQTVLTFTKTGENYISNTIEVEKSINDNFKIESTMGSVVDEGNNKYHVVIPASSIEPGSTANVKLTASISKTYAVAANYSCGDTYQSITPNYTENKVFSYADSVEGTITTSSKGTLVINKYDSNDIPLSGAKIKVTGPGYSKTFTTNGEPIVLDDLEFGTYTVEEIMSPAGYIKASNKTLTLSSEKLTVTVNLINDMTRISIVKYDEDGKTKLQGANLKLVDKDGKIINKCPDERSKSFLCEWTSTKSAKVIEGLPAGTYYLVEDSAPKGYNLSNEKKQIIISESGKVTVDGKESENGLIEFYNSITRTEISKVNGADGKQLEGATLEILDIEENPISCIIDGNDKKLDKCEWVSGKEKTIVKGLSAGVYYLIETKAPEGYELNTNKIQFEVKADGTPNEVKIENNLIVEVPDTLSSRSILLIAISMFDIALGIGILTYVKKNKIQE